jgi:hypothetical protein
MKFNKTIIAPIVALIVVVAVGYFLTRSDDDNTAEEQQQDNVVVEQANTPPSRDVASENNSSQVLGEAVPPRGEEEVQPAAPAAPAPAKPVTAAPAAPAPATQTIRYKSLGFELPTPLGFQHKAEGTNRGFAVTIFDSKNLYGTIEVISDTYTSLDQFEFELRANPTYSNISRSSFNNLPALMYNDATQTGMKTAVLVNNKLYIFSGSGLSKYLGQIRFF